MGSDGARVNVGNVGWKKAEGQTPQTSTLAPPAAQGGTSLKEAKSAAANLISIRACVPVYLRRFEDTGLQHEECQEREVGNGKRPDLR